MKLIRFMSKNEFEKFTNKENLKNKTIHKGNTDSIGFCFMQYEYDGFENYVYDFLSGIVSDEICCIFETNKKLKKGYGVYADPYGSFFDTIRRDEYSTTEYNINDFKLLKYCDKIDIFNDDWEWKDCKI